MIHQKGFMITDQIMKTVKVFHCKQTEIYHKQKEVMMKIMTSQNVSQNTLTSNCEYSFKTRNASTIAKIPNTLTHMRSQLCNIVCVSTTFLSVGLPAVKLPSNQLLQYESFLYEYVVTQSIHPSYGTHWIFLLLLLIRK